MNTWKKMLTQRSGTNPSFTNKKKDALDSSINSILTCLQAPINISKIKKQVENIFLSAKKRASGLKILAKLLSFEAMPRSARFDCIAWFQSALRNNKNEATHYLDGLKGCGHQLEDEILTNFFGIINGLVRQLKASSDESEIKVLVNALRWNFVGKDHLPLKHLEVFRVLYEGNSLLKESWGKSIQQSVPDSEAGKALTLSVFEVFEEFYLTVIGRIVRPEDHTSKISVKGQTN